MIENARQSGTLRSINPREMLPRGFQDGGPTTETIIQPAQTDPELKTLMKANIEWMEKLYNDGVLALIGDKQVRDLRDRTEVINGIEQSVSK